MHSHRSPGLTCPIAHNRTMGVGTVVFCAMNMHRTAVSPGSGITEVFVSTSLILTSAMGVCSGVTGQIILVFA